MNTLKCKALLIVTTFILFVRAIGIYLLMTLPLLAAQPLMYEMSAGYAISFGWIAGLLFLLLFYFLQKARIGIVVKKIFLYASVAIAVLVAFQAMEITGAQYRVWHSGIFLAFPAIAVMAGWISTAISKQRINHLFIVADAEYNKATDKN